MRVAKAILLTDDERVTLTKWARGRSTSSLTSNFEPRGSTSYLLPEPVSD